MAMMCSRLANTMRGQRHAALVLHGVADDREGLLAALAVRRDVVGTLVVALVDLLFGHELVDVDGVRALELDGFQLLGLDLDVLALGDLVAAPLLVLVDGACRFPHPPSAGAAGCRSCD